MPPMHRKRRREDGGGSDTGGGGGGGGGEGSTPPASAAPAENRDGTSSHLQEIASSCVQAAHMLNAASKRLEDLAKLLTSNLYCVPGARIEQNLTATYKLSFVNSLSDQIFTKREIRAADGDLIKIKITGGDGNQQFSSSPRLLSSRVKIVVLDGDFNVDNHEVWTSEEFCNHIVRPRDKVGVVLTGDLELKLKNGEAYLENATFVDNSRFMRSGKFRLGVRLIDNLGEQVQEGITEPFVVKDRRGEEYKKRKIPWLDDEVWRLQKISKGGVFHKALKKSGIHTVKDLLRLYYKDEKALRNILGSASPLVWTTIVDHAKKCDAGRALYSHFIKDKDIRLYFTSVGQIVGATIANQYNAFDDAYVTQNKALLEQWSKDAYEFMTNHQPDYEMHNGEPRPIDCSTFQGLITPSSKSTQPSDKIIHENDQQDSSRDNTFSGSLSQQWPLTSSHEHTGVNDESYDETRGSLELNQGASTVDQGNYQIPLGNYDSSVFQWGQEQRAASQCASPISQSIQSEPPHMLMENSFSGIDMHDIWNFNWEQNQLWQNILDDGMAQFLSAPNVSMMPDGVGCSMARLASCRRWIKLATLLKSMAMLRACRRQQQG